MALQKLPNLRTEILFDAVTKFRLQNKVDNDYFLQMAMSHL